MPLREYDGEDRGGDGRTRLAFLLAAGVIAVFMPVSRGAEDSVTEPTVTRRESELLQEVVALAIFL